MRAVIISLSYSERFTAALAILITKTLPRVINTSNLHILFAGMTNLCDTLTLSDR